MNLSEYSVKILAELIAGDLDGLPYRSGPQLVEFFNQIGSRDVYPSRGGFPTRRIYAQDKVRTFNGSSKIRVIITKALDPREFLNSEKSADDAAGILNETLKYDGYEVVREGLEFKVRDLTTGKVRLEVSAKVQDKLSQLLIDENIRKCELKLSDGDYSGAITNARSMVEAVLIGIEKELGDSALEYDGDLVALNKRVQKLLNLEPGRKDIAGPLRQVLSGLTSVVNGLATMRNKMGDAHATSYRPRRHHAKLAVYAATTLADFLFETKLYQQKRGLVSGKGDSAK